MGGAASARRQSQVAEEAARQQRALEDEVAQLRGQLDAKREEAIEERLFARLRATEQELKLLQASVDSAKQNLPDAAEAGADAVRREQAILDELARLRAELAARPGAVDDEEKRQQSVESGTAEVEIRREQALADEVARLQAKLASKEANSADACSPSAALCSSTLKQAPVTADAASPAASPLAATQKLQPSAPASRVATPAANAQQTFEGQEAAAATKAVSGHHMPPPSRQRAPQCREDLPPEVAAAEAKVLATRAARGTAAPVGDSSSGEEDTLSPRAPAAGAASTGAQRLSFRAALNDGYAKRAEERQKWLESLSMTAAASVVGPGAATVVKAGMRTAFDREGSQARLPEESTMPLRDRGTEVMNELRKWTVQMRSDKGEDVTDSPQQKRWVRQVRMGGRGGAP